MVLMIHYHICHDCFNIFYYWKEGDLIQLSLRNSAFETTGGTVRKTDEEL